MEDGMSFPKKGNFFPEGAGRGGDGKGREGHFATEIAAALRRSFGDGHAGIKTVAGWTGANERTVKNWFSGRYGPRGEHLVALVQRSNDVLSSFLVMSGRDDLMATAKLAAAEQAIVELLVAVRGLGRTTSAATGSGDHGRSDA
jgi:hypothetical protein